ncbi:hypothetical protein TNCV_2982461 [Trichonephila clavipes]|nr:hypothetical protein TNCV_2982461 [Trichonephila clavipes]
MEKNIRMANDLENGQRKVPVQFDGRRSFQLCVPRVVEHCSVRMWPQASSEGKGEQKTPKNSDVALPDRCTGNEY